MAPPLRPSKIYPRYFLHSRILILLTPPTNHSGSCLCFRYPYFSSLIRPLHIGLQLHPQHLSSHVSHDIVLNIHRLVPWRLSGLSLLNHLICSQVKTHLFYGPYPFESPYFSNISIGNMHSLRCPLVSLYVSILYLFYDFSSIQTSKNYYRYILVHSFIQKP